MFLDKYETFIINIGNLSTWLKRRHLLNACKQLQSSQAVQAEFMKIRQQLVLKVHIPKCNLPYFISFLSFHNYPIYQVLPLSQKEFIFQTDSNIEAMMHFKLKIDGLQDVFIKDKIIDIMQYMSHQEDINYILTSQYIDISCTPQVISKLIHALATKNIDVLGANYRPKVSQYKHSTIS